VPVTGTGDTAKLLISPEKMQRFRKIKEENHGETDKPGVTWKTAIKILCKHEQTYIN